jgi:hypothetical protein
MILITFRFCRNWEFRAIKIQALITGQVIAVTLRHCYAKRVYRIKHFPILRQFKGTSQKMKDMSFTPTTFSRESLYPYFNLQINDMS